MVVVVLEDKVDLVVVVGLLEALQLEGQVLVQDVMDLPKVIAVVLLRLSESVVMEEVAAVAGASGSGANGGNGTASTITGSSVTRAGGGGGGGNDGGLASI